jgi:hypothetical protein
MLRNSCRSVTLMVILVAGCSAYFGFGAIITGFHFAVMGNEAEES